MEKQVVEIKVTGATVMSTVVSIVVAVLNYIQDTPAILGSSPLWLQTILLIAIPPLITFIGGYMTPSSTSKVSNDYMASRLSED